MVTQEKEEHWFACLPSSRPPDGDTEAAQHRREKRLGPDLLPSTDSIRSLFPRGYSLRDGGGEVVLGVDQETEQSPDPVESGEWGLLGETFQREKLSAQEQRAC